MNLVYIVNMKRDDKGGGGGNIGVRTFGGSGRNRGTFHDPAGIAVDNKGYMIIADSRNHKLKVMYSAVWKELHLVFCTYGCFYRPKEPA